MRIKHVKIRNFRAVKEFDGEFGNITSFIGYNGSGKSSVIRAINWFFEGHPLNEYDYFKDSSGKQSDEVSVEIKFTSLNKSEKAQFKKYVKDDSMTIMRSQNWGEIKSKLLGSPNVIPGIEDIRGISGLANQRDALNSLFEKEEISASPEDEQIIKEKKAKKAEFDDLLIRLEMYTGNSSKYETRKLEEATNFQGFSGGSEIRDAAGFIFLPAGEDVTEEFESNNRGSAMNILIGTLLKDTLANSIESWQKDHAEVLQELEDKIKIDSKEEIGRKEELINSRLSMFLPGVKFKLDPSLDDWRPKPAALAHPTISNGGQEFPIENQGHGVQRATLLALLQAIADDRARDNESIDSSSLVICIEEPEVYQHPQQSRAIAKSFREAAQKGGANVQFIYATHSQHFVDFDNLKSTYRVVGSGKGTSVYQASNHIIPHISEEDKMAMSKKKLKQKSKGFNLSNDSAILKYSRKAIIEGLFARSCLIVEGDTDQFIFENMPVDSSGRNLESYGVSVINANGCQELWKVAFIFHSYGIPVYILHDGDSDSSRANNDATLRSWESRVNEFIKMGRKDGNISPITKEPMSTEFDIVEWKKDMISGCFGKYMGLLQDDLERELNEWSSFMREASKIGIKDLRSCKEAGRYLRALSGAKFSDIPSSLLEISQKVRNICQQ